MAAATPLASIHNFLALKRIAVIGVSRNESDFSRHVYREFLKGGYDVIPVNPGVTEVEGRRCYTKVGDIQPGVDGALVMTPSEASEQVVRECVAAGIRRVWLHRATGKGAVSEAALRVCEEAEIEVVAGECPFMFLSGSEFPHNVHGWIKKLTFSYPR